MATTVEDAVTTHAPRTSGGKPTSPGRLVRLIRSALSPVRPSVNVVGVIDDWLDRGDIPRFRWNDRNHPDYQVQFNREVRGQKLTIFVDYNAQFDLLGLFAYFPVTFPADSFSWLCNVVNDINFEALYGNLELRASTGTLRYRNTTCLEGIRISCDTLQGMLDEATKMFDEHTPALLRGPQGVVKSTGKLSCSETGTSCQS
jgi:hypothetical protein